MAVVPSHTTFPRRDVGRIKAATSQVLHQSPMPPGCYPRGSTTDPDADVREVGKSLPAVEVGLGIQSDSPIRVTGENEEPDASRGTRDCILLPLV